MWSHLLLYVFLQGCIIDNCRWSESRRVQGVMCYMSRVSCLNLIDQYICASHIKVTVKKIGTMLLDTVLLQIAEDYSHCEFLIRLPGYCPNFIICNSANELESAAFSVVPKLLPVGPLFASSRLGNQGGNFWLKDSDCLSWLDQQPASSVIYVAFGSFTAFNQTQFQELALGFELTNKPFLWVARPGITFKETNEGDYPQGYKEGIGCRGKIVGWAPQEKVLRHPSVACFLRHCGWNSSIEGVSNGIPFLCWPYFADRYLNESYICDVWKIGLRSEKDEIRKGEIKNKAEQLLGDKNYKAMVMDLKEKIVNSVHKGCSYKNLANVIQWIRDI